MSDVVRFSIVAAGSGGWGAFVYVFGAMYEEHLRRKRPRPEPAPLPVFNAASADAPIPVYYGYARVDPIVIFRDAKSQLLNKILPQPPTVFGGWPFTVIIAVIGEGEIESVDAMYLDGVISSDPRFAGSVSFEWFSGTDTQAASNTLTQMFADKFNAGDQGKGVAYAVVFLKLNTLAFPGREPVLQFDIRGKKTKDTRDAVTRFSPNPALAIRDFWTNTRYGRRVAEAKINDPFVTTEANYFEERVPIPVVTSTFTADPATDILTLPAAQPLQTGNQMTVSTSGSLPGGLAAGVVYYWIRLSTVTGKLAISLVNAQAGTAIDITSAGTGTQTLTTASLHDASSVYMQGGSISTNLIAFANDVPFDNGDGVRVSTNGILPQGLAAGTTYYWIRGFDLRVPAGIRVEPASTPAGLTVSRAGRLASSYANALAGVAIALGPAGNTGTLTVSHFDQPRYTCGGRLDPYANPLDNLAALCSSCRSWFFESGGQYHLVADKVTAPSFDLTVDNIIGKWSIDLGDPTSHYNRVEAHFISIVLGDKDVALSESAVELAADGGRLMSGNLTLEFTRNYYLAQRLAQLERRASRIGMRVTLTATIQGFEAFCGQVARLTHPDPGFVNKLFRVARIDLPVNDEYPIEVVEYADSVFTGDAQSAVVMPVRTDLIGVLTQVPVAPPNVSGLEIFTP